MSIRYNSVLLKERGIVFDNRCKTQRSLVVSKMPPNCLNARLLNKKGVLPGTTSMDNQSVRPVIVLARGIWTLHTLVSD